MQGITLVAVLSLLSCLFFLKCFMSKIYLVIAI